MRSIMKIAKECRKWAEEQVPDGWPDNLCGLCGHASLQLFLSLQKEGYHPGLAMCWCHCFIVIDGYRLDITATQFDVYYDEVHYEPHIKDGETPYYYKEDKIVYEIWEVMEIVSDFHYPGLEIGEQSCLLQVNK